MLHIGAGHVTLQDDASTDNVVLGVSPADTTSICTWPSERTWRGTCSLSPIYERQFPVAREPARDFHSVVSEYFVDLELLLCSVMSRLKGGVTLRLLVSKLFVRVQ